MMYDSTDLLNTLKKHFAVIYLDFLKAFHKGMGFHFLCNS